MVKDEARARTAFEAASRPEEKIVQRSRIRPRALCPQLNRTLLLGGKTWPWKKAVGRSHSRRWKKDVRQRRARPSIFRHHAAWAGDKELALQQLETGLRLPPRRSR